MHLDLLRFVLFYPTQKDWASTDTFIIRANIVANDANEIHEIARGHIESVHHQPGGHAPVGGFEKTQILVRQKKKDTRIKSRSNQFHKGFSPTLYCVPNVICIGEPV